MASETEGKLSGGNLWIVSDKAVYIRPIGHPDPSERSNGYRLHFVDITKITEEPWDSTVRRVLHERPRDDGGAEITYVGT